MSYRGKYPHRIKSVQSIGRGIVLAIANDGERVEVSALDTGGRMPTIGDDIAQYRASEPAKSPVISRHAPAGHIAIAHAGGLPCNGCAFKYDSLCPNVMGAHSCTPTKRADGRLVIFVKP